MALSASAGRSVPASVCQAPSGCADSPCFTLGFLPDVRATICPALAFALWTLVFGRRLALPSVLPSSAGRWQGPGALTHHGRPAADAARAASAPDRPPRAGPPRWPPVGPATALPPARPLPRQRRGASLGTCLTGVLLLAFQMFLSLILPLQLRRSWPRPVLFPCDSLSHTSSPLIPQVRAHQLNNFC